MSKSLQNKEYKYTQVQYFFWLFSGAEINILKDCPTDYNRQAGIGFTIFMTTLFGMFAGGYAGWYFSKSYFAASVFAIIWGLLIFSIDRTLVVTLKKDPDKPKQNFWAQFLGRAVLAGLIAFIISIPLELLIFRDQIDVQKMIDKETTILEYRNLMNESKGTNTDSEMKEDAQKSSQQALENSKNCGTDPIYSDLESQRKKIEPLWKSNHQKRDAVYARHRSLINSGQPNTASIYRRSSTYQNAVSNSIKTNSEYQKILNEQNKRCQEYKSEQFKTSVEQAKVASEQAIVIQKKHKVSDIQAQKLDSLQKESFIRDYIALENAASRKISYKDSIQTNESTNAVPKLTTKYITKTKPANEGMLFFLWLVRILFFTIEILPTLAKIATPPGAYDRAIKKREDDYALELEDKTKDYLIKQKEIRDKKQQDELAMLNDKYEIERKLQKEILEKAAEAQNLVAINAIEEFKLKHLQK